MRRITRRIGLFGPGAVIKASGAGIRKGPHVPGAPAPRIERAEPESSPPEKKSWWTRLGFGKKGDG